MANKGEMLLVLLDNFVFVGLFVLAPFIFPL